MEASIELMDDATEAALLVAEETMDEAWLAALLAILPAPDTAELATESAELTTELGF